MNLFKTDLRKLSYMVMKYCTSPENEQRLELENIDDPELEKIILDIAAMSSDPQFEYTENELIDLAIRLIKEQKA
jgi:hypothetical protein